MYYSSTISYSIGMVPECTLPMALNAAFDKSKALAEWKGPLSLTFTTTVFPDFKFLAPYLTQKVEGAV